MCLDVTGVTGGPLLVENERHQYRYFPRKAEQKTDDTEDADADADDATEERPCR